MPEIKHKGGASTEALGGKLVFEQDKNRIIGRKGTTPRLLISADENDFTMKISKPDIDVLTAANKDLIFNSANNLFKIVSSGSLTLTSPNLAGSSSGAAIAHGQDQVPIVLAFVKFSTGGTSFPIPYLGIELAGTNAGRVRYEIGYEAPESGGYITFYHRNITSAVSQTAYITYYILQETASIS